MAQKKEKRTAIVPLSPPPGTLNESSKSHKKENIAAFLLLLTVESRAVGAASRLSSSQADWHRRRSSFIRRWPLVQSQSWMSPDGAGGFRGGGNDGLDTRIGGLLQYNSSDSGGPPKQ